MKPKVASKPKGASKDNDPLNNEVLKKVLLSKLTKASPASFGIYTRPLKEYVSEDATMTIISPYVKWLSDRTLSTAARSPKVAITVARPMADYSSITENSPKKQQDILQARSSFNQALETFFKCSFSQEEQTFASISDAVFYPGMSS